MRLRPVDSPISYNQKWFDHRYGRITASKCYKTVCPRKANYSSTKITAGVLNCSLTV